MMKLCTLGGATVGGYAFWAIGDALGFDFVGSFLLSGVGSVVGIVAGWKLARKLEE
jgi:outer membrane lipoprotein SlyB